MNQELAVWFYRSNLSLARREIDLVPNPDISWMEDSSGVLHLGNVAGTGEGEYQCVAAAGSSTAYKEQLPYFLVVEGILQIVAVHDTDNNHTVFVQLSE